MVTRSLIIVSALALLSIPAQATLPLASEEVALTTMVPNQGENEQVVELYNTGARAVNLTGWEVHKFDPGHGFQETCSLHLDGFLEAQEVQTFTHAVTWNACNWSATQGQLYLYDAEGSLISTVTWGEDGDDHDEAIPPGHALERCFLVNDEDPTDDAYWELAPDPRLGDQNDPCLG